VAPVAAFTAPCRGPDGWWLPLWCPGAVATLEPRLLGNAVAPSGDAAQNFAPPSKDVCVPDA
jgi:hypothetical protein